MRWFYQLLFETEQQGRDMTLSLVIFYNLELRLEFYYPN